MLLTQGQIRKKLCVRVDFTLLSTAIIELPFRLRAGIHGSWVPSTDFLERKDLCDMSGVTSEIRKEYGEKPVRTPFKSNVSESMTINSTNKEH